MKKVLLVEDSHEIALLVASALKNHNVLVGHSLADAESLLGKEQVDLFLIDVTLPDGSGFDFCLKLSQDERFKSTPRILLTAKDEPAEKVYGFNCGAHDYITKPFHSLELRARVERFLELKLSGAEEASLTIVSGFEFDLPFQKCFRVDGAHKSDLGLTPTEFRLFYALAKRAGQVLTRHDLERVAWEAHGATIEARGIDTHISHLRKKLGEQKAVVVSVYGQGYAFKAAA